MSGPSPEHSFEEIRSAALDVLSKREKVDYPPNQYAHVESGVAEVLARREGTTDRTGNIFRGGEARLSVRDQEVFLEVFWGLFQQGIIVLGYDPANNGFPWCRLSAYGKRVLESSDLYFFHDVSTYENQIRREISSIHDVTLLYLKEAMQAFRAGCMLSATVMLGVATEHTLLLLLDRIESNKQHKGAFASVFAQKTVLQKANKFKAILDQHYVKQLPSDVKEDLDTHFASLLSVIRTFRNQAGHPTGKMMDREQVYVLLHLFIPYGKKMYQLMECFK
jgi:hypothetical protein